MLTRIRDSLSTPWKRTLLVVLFAQMITAVGFSIFFPFLPLYVESLGAVTDIPLEILTGLVYSGQAVAMMIASPIWGSLADRVGRKLMVERSMFGGAVILLLMAFARSAEDLVFLRIVQGFVTGTLAASNALVAAMAPRERTGFAMGLLQVGLAAGVALGPLLGGLIADFFGYHTSFYVTAALLFISGLMVYFGVREQFGVSETDSRERQPFVRAWRQILTTRGVLITFSLQFLHQLGRMIILPILPLFVVALLQDDSRINTVTGSIIGVTALTSTLSAVYLGRLGDRVGHRRVVIASSLFASILYFTQSYATTGLQTFVIQALAGVAFGGIIPSISALLSIYTQVGEEGAVYGLDNSIKAGARAIAPMVGTTVALWIDIRSAFIVTAFVYLITSLLASWRLPMKAEFASD